MVSGSGYGLLVRIDMGLWWVVVVVMVVVVNTGLRMVNMIVEMGLWGQQC